MMMQNRRMPTHRSYLAQEKEKAQARNVLAWAFLKPKNERIKRSTYRNRAEKIIPRDAVFRLISLPGL